MIKQTLAASVLLASSVAANAIVIDADHGIGMGGPLESDTPVGFISPNFGPGDYAYSAYFTTDDDANYFSGSAVGLTLDNVSGFAGDLNISLYSNTLLTGDDTDAFSGDLVASTTISTLGGFGGNLANVAVDANTAYSLVVWATGTLPSNAISGSIAATSEVPVPAAAWLFGSALLSVAGLKRKKKSA